MQITARLSCILWLRHGQCVCWTGKGSRAPNCNTKCRISRNVPATRYGMEFIWWPAPWPSEVYMRHLLQYPGNKRHQWECDTGCSVWREEKLNPISCHPATICFASTHYEVTVAAPVFHPFFTWCMRRGFLLMCASFVMLSTTRSDARARKGVSFYLSACRFPVFLYTNCTSVYLVWQIHFFSDLEMYYACGFVIKAMIICSSQMGVLDFGPALAD